MASVVMLPVAATAGAQLPSGCGASMVTARVLVTEVYWPPIGARSSSPTSGETFAVPVCTSVTADAATRLVACSVHSGISRHGWSLSPGAGAAPGGSTGSRPSAGAASHAVPAGSPLTRYLALNSSHDSGGGGAGAPPKGMVTDATQYWTLTVPWNGGPEIDRLAPIDT